MNPGTFYLYEYEHHIRKRNAGFLKLSRHYQSCVFQVHLKSDLLASALDTAMYAFYLDDGSICAKRIHALPVSAQTIAFRFSVSETNFPEHRSLTTIDGFFLNCFDSSALWFASDAPDNIDIRNIRFLDEKPAACRQPFPRKITISELTVLPRKFWSLSSNSFLLHGCHNYGHLLLAEQNDRLWLGVPGTYDPREARAADLFGFPRFCRSYARSELLNDQERNETADFGHWFRCVGPVSARQNGV